MTFLWTYVIKSENGYRLNVQMPSCFDSISASALRLWIRFIQFSSFDVPLLISPPANQPVLTSTEKDPWVLPQRAATVMPSPLTSIPNTMTSSVPVEMKHHLHIVLPGGGIDDKEPKPWVTARLDAGARLYFMAKAAARRKPTAASTAPAAVSGEPTDSDLVCPPCPYALTAAASQPEDDGKAMKPASAPAAATADTRTSRDGDSEMKQLDALLVQALRRLGPAEVTIPEELDACLGGALPESEATRAPYYDTVRLYPLSLGTVHKPVPVGGSHGGESLSEASMSSRYLLQKDWGCFADGKSRKVDPTHIFEESSSLDTIGNFYFLRAVHLDRIVESVDGGEEDPAGCIFTHSHHFVVLTNEFHMPRLQAICARVFALPPRPLVQKSGPELGKRDQFRFLTFLSVPNRGVADSGDGAVDADGEPVDMLALRREHEQRGKHRWDSNVKRGVMGSTMGTMHRFLFASPDEHDAHTARRWDAEYEEARAKAREKDAAEGKGVRGTY